ncbi:YceH family protein [Psychrobium sp. 1_MG-2023]|uniref:YceH family protein n=1 Tax=Psychrobium sp. 1_MG-2023 TaxID=3062624 RepID=UPI000C33ABDB|nr:YceH family protein [Psychrobium sp. 1_MG-2023]MDP2560270.1 YceH family protein [Psychrobium sp. 1_MG-2023]PKF55387.1 hypothetical protein CW748_12850 [Alteromonadales bacterium alter-6D02]
MLSLTNTQARVIGVLLEKEVTTPDQYPMSINGLMTACNQKSNREPVMTLSESEVKETIEQLIAMHLVSEQTGFGSRVIKYKHRFCNTEFSDLKLTEQQKAVLCVLLLRGKQSAGELKTRTNRLSTFSHLAEVEACLESLCHYNGSCIVRKLERQPGQRDNRFEQLFYQAIDEQPNKTDQTAPHCDATKIKELEAHIVQLKEKINELEGRLRNA